MNKIEDNILEMSIDIIFNKIPESPLKKIQEVLLYEIATNSNLRNKMLEALQSEIDYSIMHYLHF
ncbi:MAG: hypothetical protein RSA87_04195 [Malacoplasma sp.]